MRSVDELLGNISEKDISLQMKDGVRELQRDGRISSRWTQIKSRGKAVDVIEKGMQVMHPSPQGWKDTVGAKLFAVMNDWRSTAIYKHYHLKIE